VQVEECVLQVGVAGAAPCWTLLYKICITRLGRERGTSSAPKRQNDMAQHPGRPAGQQAGQRTGRQADCTAFPQHPQIMR